MRFDVIVDFDGPLFHDGYVPALNAFLHDARAAVGHQGLANVRQISDASFKRPTPYYETQIVSQEIDGQTVVHDRGIIYGPWLEGVSHRNVITRFKGYHMFRRATQALRRDVPRVVGPALRQFIIRIGGKGI